jgi:hypothetical protein
MKKPLSCLFAITFMFSVMSCNSGPQKDAAKTDTNSQQADTTLTHDSVTEISGKPGVSDVKDDSLQFHKVFSFKNFSFTVKAKGKGSLQQLSIQPSGLSVDQRPIIVDTEPVMGAEIGDFNRDGFPELLIFTQSAGSGSYGKVLAYSVNNGKSISQVSFLATNENPRINKGYRGHDQFTVVNNQLVQTFPIFEKNDTNSIRKAKNRVVTYKLKDGEASRIFEVDKVTEVMHL